MSRSSPSLRSARGPVPRGGPRPELPPKVCLSQSTDAYHADSQVSSAKEAASKVESELGNLNSTLKNIEDARPFDQLTVSRPFLHTLCSPLTIV